MELYRFIYKYCLVPLSKRPYCFYVSSTCKEFQRLMPNIGRDIGLTLKVTQEYDPFIPSRNNLYKYLILLTEEENPSSLEMPSKQGSTRRDD